MAYHLICVHPFHQYEKGQIITDPDEVTVLSADRDHHFVRIAVPDAEPEAAPAPLAAPSPPLWPSSADGDI